MNLKRYRFDEQYNVGEGVIEDPEGGWVRWDAVCPLLAEEHVKASTLPGYVSIQDFIDELNRRVPESPGQVQYLARYLTAMPGYPDLGRGLRVRGENEQDRTKVDYCDVFIHKDDLHVFRQRLQAYYRELF